MFTILALDQSSKKNGWAVITKKGLKASGVFTADDKLDYISRLKIVRETIIKLITKYKPSFIVFEDTQYQGNAQGYKVLAMTQGIMMDILFTYKIDFYIVPPVTWKSFCHIEGKKRAEQKANTKKFVADKYGLIVSEDEADAVGIATWAVANIEEDK